MKNILSFAIILLFQTSFAQVEKKNLDSNNIADFVITGQKATAETLALFYNLKKLPEKGFAIGQQNAFSNFFFNIKGKSDIKKTTASDPAIIGFDFSHITDDKNTEKEDNWYFQQEKQIIADAKKAYDQGMIVTFSWHFREPYKGVDFYSSNLEDKGKNRVKTILPAGEKNEYFKRKLDKIAAIVKNLKGNDGKLIPVIFRPFHEFDGSWFWWGAAHCSPEEYKELFAFTVTYLRDVKEVTNFLYAFSPDNQFHSEADYLKRYPGDAYVDVLGMDNYGDFDNKGEEGARLANSKLKILSDLAKQRNKIAALTETGYQITFTKDPIEGFFSKYMYNALTANNIAISYVMFWENSEDAYFVPQPNMPDTADFVEFTSKPKALLSNKLPDLYKINSTLK
ncbi:glycoside hydrolase family 26 protein [Flavobacterium daejeonense]|uniref:glycoside hydrolase family 26 protein n=1 Tax=Flavobacterium daejeonense TaxID=350893 RepID=UPI00068F5BC3|nr:glycosyl hydrolase [Flavobacterium daejeonense]